MKPDIFARERAISTRKSYTPEEIFAAGGTTAFGLKMGYSNEKLIKALEALPPIEPFSEEEWADLMDQLAKDK